MSRISQAIIRMGWGVVGAALQMFEASAQDKVFYQYSFLPTGESAPISAGIEKGFFRDVGIDLSYASGRGSGDAVKKVAAGGALVGDSDISAVMVARVNEKAPVKCIMAQHAMAPHSLFVLEGSGINSIKDLAGKTLVTTPGNSHFIYFPLVAKLNGLDPDSVKLLKVDNNALGPMLASGRVDATITWVTSGPADARLLKQAGKQLSILPWTAVGLEGYGWSILASDKIIKEHPDTVRRFVRAFIKTVEFTAKNPEKAGQDLHDLVPNADLDSNTDEIRATVPLVKNEITEKYGMGSLDPAWLQKTWEWVAKAQGYPLDKVNPETLVDRSFLPKP